MKISRTGPTECTCRPCVDDFDQDWEGSCVHCQIEASTKAMRRGEYQSFNSVDDAIEYLREGLGADA